MNNQERLAFIVKSFTNPAEFPSLRGICAHWKENTMHISFFFEGEITESIKEAASILATEIFAQFPEGFLQEEYIRLDFPHELPENEFWVYRRSNVKNPSN